MTDYYLLLRTIRFHKPKTKFSGSWNRVNEQLELVNWQFWRDENCPSSIRLMNREESNEDVVAFVHYKTILRSLSSVYRDARTSQWSSLEMQGEHVRRVKSDSSRGNALP